MKKKKANKKKKKKEEKNEEEIQPTKHEYVGNVNCFSEEIAREIINKLISYTFTSLYMKKMNKIIDNYYIRNLLGEINTLIEISYINHDMDINIPIDDSIKNKSIIMETKKKLIERRIQEKKIYNINNNNINLTEENKDSINKKTFMEEMDINYLKNKKIFYDAKISNKNFWETIPQPQSFSFERTSTYKNITKLAEETNFLKKEKKNMENNDDNNNNKKYIKIKSKYNYYISKKMDDIYLKKKKTYIKNSDELPSEKIPDEILGIQKEEEDIISMRKKLLEEIDKKNMEKKMEKERKKMEEIAKRNGDGKKKSKNKNDSDDKMNPDLFIKEFISIFTNQKEIKGGSPLSLLEKEKKEQTKKAKGKIEYNIIQKIRTEKEQLLHKKLQQKILFKKYKLKNINKEESNSEEDEEPPGNLKPSGSNFALMKPEVGVIIQENAKVKSGGINFSEKYNKFSFNDFNKTMNNIFARNFSNIMDNNNTYTSGKININNNNTMTTFNNDINKKKRELSNISDKIDEKKKEEFTEKNLFKKTFTNRLTNLKKKFMYKSRSEICLSNNCNSDIFREALSTGKNEKSYYYYSNNLFDSNKSKNEFNNNFELTYIGRRKSKFNQLVNNKFFSPLPTNLLNIYKNTLLKNYIHNADKDDSYQKNKTTREKYNKYNLIDNFNKNIVDGNNKYNDILTNKIMKITKNDFLPKIKNGQLILKKGNRTKNYFFRTRKKENGK